MGLGEDIIDTVTGDGGGSGGSGGGGGSVLPGWVEELGQYSAVLIEFGKNPAGFILGAVLSSVLGGIEAIVSAIVDAIFVVALGSDKTISATGTLGMADIPLYALSLVTGGAGRVVGALTTTIRVLNRTAVDIATVAGPLSPVLYAAMLSAVMIVSAWALRTGIEVIADAVPGLQGLT